MGTFAVTCHNTKLYPACIEAYNRKWREIYALASGIEQFFPDCRLDWDDVVSVLRLGIASGITVTASLSKAESVPDETFMQPVVEVPPAKVPLMCDQARSLNISMDSALLCPEPADDSPESYAKYRIDLADAADNWAAACSMLIEIDNKSKEIEIWRAYGAGVCDPEGSDTRTPGQMAMMQSPWPLASSEPFTEKFSVEGLKALLGNEVTDWFTRSQAGHIRFLPAVEFWVASRTITLAPELPDPEGGEDQPQIFIWDSSFHLQGTLVGVVMAQAEADGELRCDYNGPNTVIFTLTADEEVEELTVRAAVVIGEHK